MIDGAIARFECVRHDVHAAGDHDIIVGEVKAFDQPREAPALVFHQSDYGESRVGL